MPDYRAFQIQQNVLRYTAEQLKERMYTPIAAFGITLWRTKEPVPFARRHEGERLTVKAGEKWGELWDCAWFELEAVLPPAAAGKKLVAKIDLSGEALLVDENGEPRKGFTSVKSRMTDTLGRMGKTVCPVAGKPGDTVRLILDAGNNDLFGNYRGGTVEEACIAVCNEQLRALYYDFAVLFELSEQLPQEGAFRWRIVRALSQVERTLRTYSEEEAAACREILRPLLAVRAAETGFDLSVLGHAHIDLAWYWPVRETVRKGARTFSTALHHMGTYGSYIFGASQAWLYDSVGKAYPALTERIRARVREGRWELQGGMWVESDLNIPNGESLVRQFVYGQRYFQETFGRRCTVGWLPDSFGFCGNLPQLLYSAGMETFVTQKIRTAPHNICYPHDTFFWEGIDGTRVLTHVAPFENYGSGGTPREVSVCEQRFRDKLVSDSALLLVGQGDGGGGAGAECLEALEREESLEGLPPCALRTAEEFFARIGKTKEEYAVWHGAMDLDMHTGTLTSSAESKRFNKEAETALHTLEWLCAARGERADLREIWERVLLYQFHDILTGTSIGRVYEESFADYRRMLAELNGRIRALEGAEKSAAADACGAEKGGAEDAVTLFNPSPVQRDCVLDTPVGLVRAQLPPYSAGRFSRTEEAFELRCTPRSLENSVLKVTFGEDGAIVSVRHKRLDREMVRGAANRLLVYDDFLHYSEEEWGVESAWDMPVRYKDREPYVPVLTRMRSYLAGGCAVMETEYKVLNSTIVQRAVLRAESGRIVFETEVDWRESCKMLRSLSGVNVTADEALRGVQFGCARVPLNKNTVWEYAVFERAVQRWADISEEKFGVALLPSGKYGVRLQDKQLDLCLLRSSGYPAKDLDVGRHAFTYALYFHEGNAKRGRVLEEAYALEYPLGVSRAADLPEPLFRQKYGSVFAETVKPAEDGRGVIVRLYEGYGNEETEAVLPAARFGAFWETNILEEKLRPLALQEGALRLVFRPFEVKTLLFSEEKE